MFDSLKTLKSLIYRLSLLEKCFIFSGTRCSASHSSNDKRKTDVRGNYIAPQQNCHLAEGMRGKCDGAVAHLTCLMC